MRMFLYGVLGVLVVLMAIMLLDRSYYEVRVVDTFEGKIEDAWKVLALEYANIHRYSEFVDSVQVLTGDDPGLGCVRRCTLADGGFMQEEIVAWQENKELKIEIKDSSMPMVPGTSVHFHLAAMGNKIKIVAVGSYRLKYFGPLSPVIAKDEYTRLIKHLIDIVKDSV